MVAPVQTLTLVNVFLVGVEINVKRVSRAVFMGGASPLGNLLPP